jgi:hypothetical protein
MQDFDPPTPVPDKRRISMTSMKVPADPEKRAAAMRRRAADWAAGEAEAKAFDRRRAAAMTVDERLAEGVELTRIAERLRESVRARRST